MVEHIDDPTTCPCTWEEDAHNGLEDICGSIPGKEQYAYDDDNDLYICVSIEHICATDPMDSDSSLQEGTVYLYASSLCVSFTHNHLLCLQLSWGAAIGKEAVSGIFVQALQE